MTEQMTREQVVDIITAARAKGERPDLSDLDMYGLNLSYLDLSDVDMSGSNLSHSNLSYTDLGYSNLYCANLYCANLAHSNLNSAIFARATLSYADLRSAILTKAFLVGANLTGANLPGLFLDGLPSGNLFFIPTPEGWHLTIGCWSGTTTELREMIAGNEGWPEAEGKEIAVRRPMLTAAADICEAYANANPDALAQVRSTANQWKENNN